MIRMFAKRMTKRSVAPGTDSVIVGMSLPSGSKINNINIDFHVWELTLRAVAEVFHYAVEGWILPVHDPDGSAGFDTLWDTLVPKDTDVETMDLDTGAADVTNFYEPGEPDFSDMLEVGLRPERIYHRNRVLTMANGSISTTQDAESPFAPRWVPGDNFQIRIKRNFMITQPSVLVFGLASPVMDDTTTAIESALAESNWGQVKYIQHVLQRALLHVLGVVEAGAETPWEEATALLKRHLEPDVIETVAGEMAAATWHVYASAMFDHSVEGEMGQTSISTGR